MEMVWSSLYDVAWPQPFRPAKPLPVRALVPVSKVSAWSEVQDAGPLSKPGFSSRFPDGGGGVVPPSSPMVAVASESPAPQPLVQPPGIARVPCRSVDSTWAGVRAGTWTSSGPTRPATCGAAIEVPW